MFKNYYGDINEAKVMFADKGDIIFMTVYKKTERNPVPGNIRVIKTKNIKKFFSVDNPQFDFEEDMAQDVELLSRGETMGTDIYPEYMIARA